jgi:hypothetical protein
MSKYPELEILVGTQITAVCFVMDYVQFQFGGPILSALSDPVVKSVGFIKKRCDSGYRDALCSTIGETVREAQVRENEVIKLTLANDTVIEIPIDEGSKHQSEAATLQNDDPHVMLVW